MVTTLPDGEYSTKEVGSASPGLLSEADPTTSATIELAANGWIAPVIDALGVEVADAVLGGVTVGEVVRAGVRVVEVVGTAVPDADAEEEDVAVSAGVMVLAAVTLLALVPVGVLAGVVVGAPVTDGDEPSDTVGVLEMEAAAVVEADADDDVDAVAE